MKIIITGATGMVGEGVLLVCLADPKVTDVLSVSRKPTGRTHPKLKELLVRDFLSLPERDANLAGYDACFYCAGISSIGVKEPEFTKQTYDTALAFAKAVNPDVQTTFIYVSGAGTRSSEKSRQMWARVKGKTENDLIKLPFKNVFAFRPGFMKAVSGQKNLPRIYKLMAWLFPVFKVFTPNYANTLNGVGLAMIEAAQYGYEKKVVEVKDINILAERARGHRE